MSIFPNRARLSDPTEIEEIPNEDFTYVITRAQLDAFNAVHAELAKTNLQRKTLAKRLGMNEGQLSRLLGAPGNWRLETIAKLFWAISGGRLKFSVEHPMQKARRNDTRPWDRGELKLSVTNDSSGVFEFKQGLRVNISS